MRPPYRQLLTRSLLALSALTFAACGGSSKEPRTARPTNHAPRRDDSASMSAASEVGGMNQEASEAAFNSASADLQRCYTKSAARFELLSGDIAFVVEVDQTGKLVRSYVERSDLGHRPTEDCMLAALGRQTWPATVGGKIGQARYSIGFEPGDGRPAVPWSADDVRTTLDELGDKLGACPGAGRGDYQVTWYVDTDGKVMVSGYATPTGADPAGARCVSAVISGATFPSPGSWPAKVSVEL